jgi:hypothetical protein
MTPNLPGHTSSRVDLFLKGSANLLELSLFVLQGSGVAETLCTYCCDRIGEAHFDDEITQLVELSDVPSGKVRAVEHLLTDPFYGPLTRNLQIAWYTGSWVQLPEAWHQKYAPDKVNMTSVISSRAYQEGLIWPMICAHPPGAKQQGWAAWSQPPTPSDLQ